MARRRLSDTTHPDTTLDESYWLKFGDQPQPPMRNKIIYLTSEEVAAVGPTEFNVASVSDRLGITHPMVNHYFGGRDSLIAETAYFVYRRYITNLWAAVQAAPAEPRERLRRWIHEQILRTRELGGWGGILNYPSSTRAISAIIEDNYGPQMEELFANNIVRLGSLVEDIRNGVVTDWDLVDSDELSQRLLSQKDDPNSSLAAASSIAWSTLGVSVWNAGQHLPSSNIPRLLEVKDAMMVAHIERIIASI